MQNSLEPFESANIRHIYDEDSETWFFSVVDIIQALIQQTNFQAARKYWNKLKERLNKEGNEFAILTKIIHQEWSGVSVKEHKNLKGLETHNLRDHMTKGELIFTALAELSTRQIAENTQATGLPENSAASKVGGGIAQTARIEFESKTGTKVLSGRNYLPTTKRIF